MNAELKLAVDGHHTLISLTPDMYDGHPPIDSITYQTRMRVLDPDVYAVSTAIALQNFASESITYSKPVQVHVADAIEDFLSNRKFRISPIEQNPARSMCGERRVTIGKEGKGDSGNLLFSLGDTHSFSSSSTIHSVHISSNISCFFSDDEKGRLLAAIAAATFVAPDYSFGEICLSKKDVELMGKFQFSRYQTLLGSINLKLREEK